MKTKGKGKNQLDSASLDMLGVLQVEPSVSLRMLASRVGLSIPAATRRIKRLRQLEQLPVGGLVPAKFGLLVAFIFVRTHSTARLKQMAALAELPNVVGIYRIGDPVPYMIKVIVRDVHDFGQALMAIRRADGVRQAWGTLVFQTVFERYGFSVDLLRDESSEEPREHKTVQKRRRHG